MDIIEEKYLKCKKSDHNLKKVLNAMKDKLCDLSEQYILANKEGREDIAKESFPFLMKHAQNLQRVVGRMQKQMQDLMGTLMLLLNRRE